MLEGKNYLVWAVSGIWGLKAVHKVSQGGKPSRAYYLNGVKLATKVEVQATNSSPKSFPPSDSHFKKASLHCSDGTAYFTQFF